MSFSPQVLHDTLAAMPAPANAPARYLIAFSGGLDSVVLCHAMAALRPQNPAPLLAIHIDHSLHPESSQWAARSEAIAAEIGVQFLAQRVVVESESGTGIEAAAREARYAALAVSVRPGDCLLSAHHQDDQAETLLLNLLRGSGPAGLAGIAACRAFADGYLLRPLLDVPRAALHAYALEHRLHWIEDPSNQDTELDRNFLRHRVLPRLAERWPGAAAALSQSARHASDATELLDELAGIDLDALGNCPQRLELAGLRALSPARAANVLRFALRRLGLPLPARRQMQALFDDVLAAGEDAGPLLRWPGAECRRYRRHLYLQPALPAADELPAAQPLAAGGIELGGGLGVIGFEAGAERGLPAALVEAGLTLSFRRGGEEIKPSGQQHTKKLKKLLQEAAVVPWMRDRVPLLYAGERLVAVADLWLADEVASDAGLRVRWSGHPPLY